MIGIRSFFFTWTLAQLVVLGKAYDLKCSEHDWGHTGQGNCCNNKTYTVGHTVPKFMDECDVEPADQSLSYANSYWTYYECIVKKALIGEKLTAVNYGAMMSKNTPEEDKIQILSIYSARTKDMDESTPDLAKLKQLWLAYFDADFQVCGDGMRAAGRFNGSERQHWDLSSNCGKERYPAVFKPMTEQEEDAYEACVDKIINMAKSDREKEELWHLTAYACFLDNLKIVTVDEIIKSDKLNFEDLFATHLPKFWSKGAKEMMIKGVRERFKAMKMPFGKDFVKKVLKERPMDVKQKHNPNLKQFYVNIHVIDAFEDVEEEVKNEVLCSASK